MLDSEEINKALLKIVGSSQISDSQSDLQKYGKDWINDYDPKPGLIIFPKTYLEIQKIMSFCNENLVQVVPSGGRTGLSGGATATKGEVIISLERMNKILSVNHFEASLTCQAGTLTQTVQEAALKENLYFPVDFASKGSSQIGGNIATNAGGIKVIRYGNIRDWVLGLKIVTAQGELIELNGNLVKNQTGYDLRHLMIGSEGTLGIIVEATLRLTSPPVNMTHVICGLNEPDDVLKLFTNSRRCFRGLSTFEYFSRLALEIVLKKTALHEPLPEACKQYALIEIEHEDPNFTNTIEEFFAHAIEQKTILNATISQSSKQSTEFLNYREMIPEVLNSTFTLHKNDISLPISKIAEFLKAIESSVQSESPDFKFVIFGHIGDGNLHINILKPSSLETGKFYERCKEIDKKIYELVKLNKGSISAEHGIGLLKKEFLHFSRSETEVQIMRDIKKVLDPNCILNAGKIF